jgi:hypothetical protein
MGAQGLEVGAPVDELDVDAGLSEPAPEIAPNPARAVDRDPQSPIPSGGGRCRPLLSPVAC